MTVSKAIARAWTDPDYKAKLLADPRSALAEAGVSVPAGTTIKVIADTVETKHLVLPISPAEVGEVTVEELEKVLNTGKIEVPVGTLGHAAC